MKRLLVTGGCGFLGSHVVRRWLADNAETSVINIDCLTYAGALGNLRDARSDARHRHKDADVADAAAVDRAVRGPLDLVIHFAAETHVDRSLEDPGRFVRTNVLGTQTLLAAIVRRYPSPEERPVVIIMSTDEVYGPTPKNQLHGVGEPLRPTSPYAASKAGADWMALSYARTFDLDLTIVRSVNVFGPH
ncbi:MAG: NAD-dependent epimerase/dehydratase family protein, partial [candidate division Zixibacteria bacterium]|nr:NAD-dependent epimerase/dehydratase family protein [candidate division Zixibacteria bacterium]